MMNVVYVMVITHHVLTVRVLQMEMQHRMIVVFVMAATQMIWDVAVLQLVHQAVIMPVVLL